MSVWSKLSRARRFSWDDWKVFLAAFAWLPVVQLTLRFRGLKRAQCILATGEVPLGSAPKASEAATAKRVAAVVDAASRHHFMPVNCLPRSLVLQRLLARRGIPSQLRIGVDLADGVLKGHAWVEYDGRPLGEAPDIEDRFPTLRRGGAVRT